MDKVKLMVARFPFGRHEDPDVTDWMVANIIWAKQSHLIDDDIINYRRDDTPITMGRNEAIAGALENDIDFLLMVDSDMKCDAYLPSNPNRLDTDPEAVPFLESAVDHLIRQRQIGKPSVIGAPYCGPPPIENIFVFRWGNCQSDHPAPDFSLDQYTRAEAAVRRGIEEVAALPTGLILIDMKAIEKLTPPYTYYEYKDEREMEKASTEDVTFTRDLALFGVPLFVNWSAWCGHWKRKCVGKPVLLSGEQVGDKYREAVLREMNLDRADELVVVGKRASKNGDNLTESEKDGKWRYIDAGRREEKAEGDEEGSEKADRPVEEKDRGNPELSGVDGAAG